MRTQPADVLVLIQVLLVEFAELQFIFLTITVSVYTVLQAGC